MMPVRGSPPITVARFYRSAFRTGRCTTWPCTLVCLTGSIPTVRTTARCADRAMALRRRPRLADAPCSRTSAAVAGAVGAVRRRTRPGARVGERSSLLTARLDEEAAPLVAWRTPLVVAAVAVHRQTLAALVDL